MTEAVTQEDIEATKEEIRQAEKMVLRRVAISLPMSRPVPEFVVSLANLIARFGAMHPGPSTLIRLNWTTGSLVACNRQELAEAAVAQDCTHVLFLDDDMTFPAETLHRLLEHDLHIVGANYPTRRMPLTTVASLGGKRLRSAGRSGVQEVSHTGAGCLLIKTEVFKAMAKPWFNLGWVREEKAGKENYVSEDVYFCMKARAAGFRTFIDHDLSNEIGHVGTVEYTHDDIPLDLLPEPQI